MFSGRRLDRTLWDAVQAQLKARTPLRAATARTSQAPALLKGLLFAEDWRAMTPVWTSKNGKYYRYYVNTATIKIGRDAPKAPRKAYLQRETAVGTEWLVRFSTMIGHRSASS